MRLGVLDVGSNTVHLLVVDAHRGAHPWPAYSEKSVLRLAEQIGRQGRLSREGEEGLVEAVRSAATAAKKRGTEDLLAFATSAVRDASNSADVLARIRAETGVDLQVLGGDEEARVTFLAVRRWFGWSAGRLLVLDIGGGSLEMAAGIDEYPQVALSLPLGAGRLTRERLDGGSEPPRNGQVEALSAHATKLIDKVADDLTDFDHAVGSSKTFRTLARLTGAAPSGEGLWVRRPLPLGGLRQVLGFLRRMPPEGIAELDGVSPRRAHQLVAGAVVAEAAMTRLGVDELDVSPWALREGVILRRLDQLA